MKTWVVDELQGSPEWLAGRKTRRNASDLACAMGIDPNGRKRSDLVKQIAIGIDVEFSDYVQERVINRGHMIEEKARVIMEMRTDNLFLPRVYAGVIDGITLGSSLDGIYGKTTLEVKSSNAELRAAVMRGEIPIEYRPQNEQGLWLSGAEVCLFVVSDGTDEGTISCEYRSDPELRAKIIPTWKQLEEDVKNYHHVEAPAEVVSGRAPDMLPALHIEVTGMVTASNLAQFKETALAVFRGINTSLQTDQDFADAEKAVKFCKDAEDRLDAAKSHALSQTASIDELFRTIDQIKDEAKAVRLKLDKLVKGEKENRKTEIVIKARDGMLEHLHALEDRIGGAWMPRAEAFPPVGDVVKGLKTLDSMRDRLSVWLANAKVQANEIADRIERNHKSVDDWTLVPDFGAICQKAPEDFAALIGIRKMQRAEAEEKRLEAERAKIRAEEQAKAERDAESARLAHELAEREAVKIEAEQAQGRDALAEDRAKQEADALSHGFGPEKVITSEEKRAVVVKHQDEIAAFMASRDFGKHADTARAILIEFVKFQADRALRKAA